MLSTESPHPLSTLRKIRSWFGADWGPAGRLMRTSFAGILVILGIATGIGFLAVKETESERSGAAEIAAAHRLEGVKTALNSLESAHRSYLLSGQPALFEAFQLRKTELQKALEEFEAPSHEEHGLRDSANSASHEIKRWLETTVLPEIEARRSGQDVNGLAARNAGKPIIDGIHAQLAQREIESSIAYETARKTTRLIRYFQIGSTMLLAALAIGFLVASAWSGIESFREHLQKNETAHAQTRAIIATTLDGVITVDDHGQILSMNPAAEKMFAQTEREMLGKSFSTLIPQRHLLHDMNGASRGAMMAIGQRQGYYPFPIEISLNEMVLGSRKQFVAIIRDVSERKRSEETLKHIGLGVSAATGEEFVRTLLKELSKALEPEYAFLVEISGRGDEAITSFTLASKGVIQRTGAQNLLNTACGEALTKGFRIYPKDVLTRFPEDHLLEELGAESFVAMPLLDHKQRTIGLMGVIDRKPLGETQLIESALQIIGTRAGAEIVRKRIEEDLAAEKERLAVTLRSIGEGFITTNNEGNVLMLNAVAESLIGWTQMQAVGKPLFDIFHLLQEKTRKRCTHALARIVETGTSEEIKYPALLVSSDGRERLVECSTSPIRDKSNRKVGVVIVFRDVTEKMRAAEEQQKAEKLESLGLVAGGIAHDFNNVLTMIVGNVTTVLKFPGLDARIYDHLNAAKKATARAEELAKQLLPFAKGGAPVLQIVSIAQLIRDTVAFTLQGSKTWCESSFPEDLWPVEVDPGQISQVIHHLAQNADQAMPAGGNIRIVAENLELQEGDLDLGLRAGRWVRVSIKDEGIGIPEDYRQKIFDPYFTTKPKGAGLGLATAHRILKNHGTIITVDSEPGMGSAFTTYLPASERELPISEAPATPEVHTPSRVLVLDDEVDICMIIQCALEDLGHEVTVTHDGKDAVAAYETALKEERRYDLVVSDLSIPGGMGGKETIKRLCQIDPEVRAIVSSGYANDPVMSRYQDFGFTGMIAKPYHIDAMCRKVAEVLATPRQPRAVSDESPALQPA
jgi:PAS domain S-box-containing protein